MLLMWMWSYVILSLSFSLSPGALVLKFPDCNRGGTCRPKHALVFTWYENFHTWLVRVYKRVVGVGPQGPSSFMIETLFTLS